MKEVSGQCLPTLIHIPGLHLIFVWLTRGVNHSMLWPKIFILGWNKYGMEWLSHGLLSLQISSSLHSAELHKLPSFRKQLFCGCNTTLSKIGFYLPVVMRSSLLLRFYTLAFLQSACLLSADYSEELCSHRSTFQFESAQQTCLRISENI